MGRVQTGGDVLLLLGGQNGHQVPPFLHAVGPGLGPALPGVGLQFVAVGAELSPAAGQVALGPRIGYGQTSQTVITDEAPGP